ncbi:MAG: mandelate racemase/muconate lactonizing enzyme family protein [Planctomycetaceae bacterium]|nr:mandelate racemase/muconate lactonizing enzyme family protein [Planctomycetaceae bacterium]
MATSTSLKNVQLESFRYYFLPVEMRMPLKFGSESVSHVNCLRVSAEVVNSEGHRAEGWGETPLSVTWAWPSTTLSYDERYEAMVVFCEFAAQSFVEVNASGHPMEISHVFLTERLLFVLEAFNKGHSAEPMPYLAALIVMSAFDIAIHDAYGNLHQVDTYSTYNSEYMTHDLSHYFHSSPEANQFQGLFPADFLEKQPLVKVPVWHLVGGLDPLEESDKKDSDPDDGYPVVLTEWIKSDGLQCLKIKLKGTDPQWDYERIVKVGAIAIATGVDSLSVDFNCTVKNPEYVNSILDRLKEEQQQIFDLIVYVEQPFPYDLEANQIDVSSLSSRKPLFLDESAHDWKFVELGRQLGWTGVALKTCKTQTGALLSLCWAKAHNMPLMVQDLTNPMLAQIPHVRLAAHAGTIRGVESNGMQFYPAASEPEQRIHPGIYQRRNGQLDLSTLSGTGFGYRLSEIERQLPSFAKITKK